ncbi:hypothetical protein BJ742DRAFT_812677 [Cladochytrium replicatum]|nr:hypothetical protein BJ742DRAFT_812677 [Cladochytrium replicatum]
MKGKRNVNAILKQHVRNREIANTARSARTTENGTQKSVSELLGESRRGFKKTAHESTSVHPSGTRAAGPPAPVSWIERDRRAVERAIVAGLKDKAVVCLVGRVGRVPTLLELCSKNIGLRLLAVAKVYEGLFLELPVYLREVIIAAGCDQFDDRLLLDFVDHDITTLVLSGSRITARGLAKAMAVRRIDDRNEEVADNWEDNDDWRQISVVVTQNLDVSMCRRLNGIQFGTVLLQTFVMLHSLNVSGCFGPSDGPPCLRIIANNLVSLRHLIVSHSEWLSMDVIRSLELEQPSNLRVLVSLTIEGSDAAKTNPQTVLTYFRKVRPKLEIHS